MIIYMIKLYGYHVCVVLLFICNQRLNVFIPLSHSPTITLRPEKYESVGQRKVRSVRTI